MARTVETTAGPIRNVPDNVTDEEVQARVDARQQSQALGNPVQQMRRQLAQQTGPIQTALVMASQFLAERRVPGFDKLPPGVTEALREESPVSSFIGDVTFPVLAGVAAPGTVLAQGAVQAGLEAAREGTDPVQIGLAGGTAAAGAGVGNFISRLLGPAPASGIRPTIGQRLLSEGETFGAGVMRRVEAILQTFGGLDDLAAANQRMFNRTVAKSFGSNADDLTPQVLAEAQERIGGMFNKLIPRSLKIDTSSLADEYLRIFDDIGPTARKIFGKKPPAVMNGTQYNNFRQAVTRQASKLARVDATKADELSAFITEMDNVVNAHVGPDTKSALRIAREMYKNLKLVESIPEVVKRGNVSKAGLNQRLTSGYGRSFIQDTGKVLPETQGMFNVMREINQLNPVIGDSGTALRAIGVMEPITAMGNLLLAPTVGRALGAAGRPAVGGAAFPLAGGAAAAAGFQETRRQLTKPPGPGR